MRHGRDSSDSWKKRIERSELRLSRLSRVSEHVQLVTRRVLNTTPSQDIKVSTDGVQEALSTFDICY